MSKFLSRKISSRFWAALGFAALAILVFTLLIYKFWNFPNGLSDAEIASATLAGNLDVKNFAAGGVVNLPWLLLQKLSIKIFGLSAFSLRLPAVMVAILAVAGVILIAYRAFAKKFGRTVAVVAGLLFATLPTFLLLARTGAAPIFTLFLLILIVAAAAEITTLDVGQPSAKIRALVWKIVLGAALALVIYAPGGIYFAGAFVLVGLLHPKVRLMLVRVRLWKMAIGAAVGLVILSPLILAIVAEIGRGDGAIWRSLLDIPAQWSAANFGVALGIIGGWTPGFRGGILTPIANVALIILALVGLWRLAKSIFAARTYLIFSLLIVAFGLAFVDPAQSFLLILLLILLATVGVAALVDDWFSRFPRNPYARGLAVALLGALFVGVAWTNVGATVWALNYNRAAVYAYDQEFSAVARYAAQNNSPKIQLVVANSQRDFYAILARENPKLTVVSSDVFAKNPSPAADAKLLILNSAKVENPPVPREIITNAQAKNSVLMRIY